MASAKISVDALEQQKREYEKAVKNLESALEQIKKVNRSLGKDAMLEDVRSALTKLSASLETRAGTLLLMTKALEQSGEKYTASQKKAVSKSNQFRAHNRDFYGNPVVVTVTTAAAAAAPATAAAAAPAATPSAAAAATPTATPAAAAPMASTTPASAAEVDVSIHMESQNTETIPFQAESGIHPTAEPVFVDSMGSGPVTGGAVPGAVDTGSSDPGAAAFAAGAAAVGAAMGGLAGAAAGALIRSGQEKTEPTLEEKGQDPSANIEAQLEAARERLRRLNEMEEQS